MINVGPGDYSLEVTDNNGCKSITSAKILGTVPAVAEICMVTVDSVTGKNMIVWDQAQNSGISHYNIYKETTRAGVFNYLASVNHSELSLYVDTVSDPTSRSWRYKISAVDECGNESVKSSMHKTMHLTLNVGINNEINLIWDDYEGFDFGTYVIYRYTEAAGWDSLDALPSTLHTYTDKNPTKDTKHYVVAVIKDGDECLGEKGLKSNAGPFSRSLSNLEDNRLQSTGFKPTDPVNTIKLYPNPTQRPNTCCIRT